MTDDKGFFTHPEPGVTAPTPPGRRVEGETAPTCASMGRMRLVDGGMMQSSIAQPVRMIVPDGCWHVEAHYEWGRWEVLFEQRTGGKAGKEVVFEYAKSHWPQWEGGEPTSFGWRVLGTFGKGRQPLSPFLVLWRTQPVEND